MVIHSSELRVWLAAMSVSVIAHSAIIGYYYFYEETLIESQNKAVVSRVHLTLEQVGPEPEQSNTENNNPEPKQSKARNAKSRKPELKPLESKKSVNNTPEWKQPRPAITEVNKPELKQPESIADEPLQLAAMSTAPISSLVSDDLRKEYFRLLTAHIEAHKYYPRRARNRDIEGIVEISFDLLKNGNVTNIQTSGGHRLLRAATKHAIQQSLPLQIPPPFLQLPLEIHFSMRFDLK
jgi:protein TonB